MIVPTHNDNPSALSVPFEEVTTSRKNLRKSGLIVVTVVYDVKELFTSSKYIKDINEFAVNTLNALEEVFDDVKNGAKEACRFEWAGSLKNTCERVNGILGVFKIFSSIHDLSHGFEKRSKWKQTEIVLKAVNSAALTVDWTMKNIVVPLKETSRTIGSLPLGQYAGKMAIGLIKSWSNVIACVFSIIDAVVTLKNEFKQDLHKKSWLTIACEVVKIALSILTGSLGFVIFAAYRPIIITLSIMNPVLGLIKAGYEIHQERLKHAAKNCESIQFPTLEIPLDDITIISTTA